MLILSRRVDEVMKLGEDISVAVLGVRRNQVHIVIGELKSISIQRKRSVANDN